MTSPKLSCEELEQRVKTLTNRALERDRMEQEVERIFNLSIDMIGSGNLQGYFTKVNSSFKKILGYSEKEILEKPFIEFVHDDDVEKTKKTLADAASGKKEIYIENRYKCKDGSHKWIEWKVLSIVKENRFIAVGRDVTERKRKDEVLRKSRDRFRNLTEMTSDWIWEVDKDGCYTYASPKVKDMLGYDPEEIIGKTPYDLMPPDEAKRVSENFSKIVASKQPFNCLENVNLHKNGQVVVIETSGTPIFNADGALTGYRGIDRDISRRKKAENELLQAHNDLDRRVKERTAELHDALEKIKHSEEELIQRKSALEILNRELLETNQAVTVLARNMDRKKEDLERKIYETCSGKLMPILKKLQKDVHCKKREADLSLIINCLDEIVHETPQAHSISSHLTEQEMRVAMLIKTGLTNRQIADSLCISLFTVKTHRRNIRKKLNLVNSDINLVSYLKSKLKSNLAR